MGVQLNIKNAEARLLAERVAAATGVSITEAVTHALRRRLQEIVRDLAATPDGARAREAEFYTLIGGSRDRWAATLVSADHGDLLYDGNGLPR